MRLKLMTLRYSSTLGGFDATPLDRFVTDKELLTFKDHFFLVNGVAHLLCVLTWRALECPGPTDTHRTTENSGRRPGKGRDRSDPRDGLDERQRQQFDTLREWRQSKALDEGVPPYVVLTNKELVAIIKAAPDSLTALGHVEGIGKAKLERHGGPILERLAAADPGTRDSEKESSS